MPSTPPYQSKLIPYQEAIMHKWYSERATLKVIQAWLAEENVTITLSGLSAFIRRRRKINDPHSTKSKVSNEKKPSGTLMALDELQKLMK